MVRAKRGVGLRVLVAAVDRGLLRQRHQLLQRLPHHLRVALDDAAAADGKQRVADEGHVGRGDPIADVAGGVAGRVQHPHLVRAELEGVALAYLRVDAGDPGRLGARADDGALGLGLERQVAVGVVAVVVGGEDVREPPALLGERGGDRLRIGRIDRGHDAGVGVADQHAEIVGEARELVNFELGHEDNPGAFALLFRFRDAP